MKIDFTHKDFYKALVKAEDAFIRKHGFKRVMKRQTASAAVGLPVASYLAACRNNYQEGEWYKPGEPGSLSRSDLLMTLKRAYGFDGI